jgi:hypothetical protein
MSLSYVNTFPKIEEIYGLGRKISLKKFGSALAMADFGFPMAVVIIQWSRKCVEQLLF